MHKAIFLDRDGVLNRKAPEGEYITQLGEFELLPGAIEAMVYLFRHDFRIIVVSNQRGIALGKISQPNLEEIHRYLQQTAAAAGCNIEQVYVCPHDYHHHCECRKPLPGMLLRAAREHDLDLRNSWMIGDSPSDIAAGRSAGCKTGYVGEAPCPSADLSASSLIDLVRQISTN